MPPRTIAADGAVRLPSMKNRDCPSGEPSIRMYVSELICTDRLVTIRGAVPLLELLKEPAMTRPISVARADEDAVTVMTFDEMLIILVADALLPAIIPLIWVKGFVDTLNVIPLLRLA